MKHELILAAASATGALAAFPFAAAQKGWRVGEWFSVASSSRAVPYVCLACYALLLSIIGAGIFVGQLGWLWILWAIVANFVAGPALVAILRGLTPTLLVAAPALSVGAYIAPY